MNDHEKAIQFHRPRNVAPQSDVLFQILHQYDEQQ
jgi:hypothetical protein